MQVKLTKTLSEYRKKLFANYTTYALQHNIPFSKAYKFFGLKYPSCGYGSRFFEWLDNDMPKPYESYGNGSAMRVSFVSDFFKSKEKIIEYATKSAECTHNHPEGIKGAVTTAICIWMAKNGSTREEILQYAIKQYPKEDYLYGADLSIDEIRNRYR